MTGKFITIEGGEGVGKSTQIANLAAALEGRGIDVVITREPGGSAGAELIRELLLSGSVEAWTPTSEALLFAAARADHVERTIRPALDRGAWIICDRFIDSSRAYQGAAGKLGDDAIMQLHDIGSAGLMPDRTLLLSLPPDMARARAQQRDGANGDRFENKSDDYHDLVADFFHTLSSEEPGRVVPIDASGDRDEVHDRIMAAIADLLP